MSAKCKKCGSEQSLFRFRFPDDDEPPVVKWVMECMTCGENISGNFDENDESATALNNAVASKFWI